MPVRSFIAFLLLQTAAVGASEVQDHGFAFERLVISQLTGGDTIEKSYTSEWDIPAAANTRTGLPVSVKFTQWKNSVYLGDAIRQHGIRERFEMVVGFYQPEPSRSRARIVALHHLTFQPEQWRSLWGSVRMEELEQLAVLAKSGTIEEARVRVGPEADALRDKCGIFSIHPKINRDQRRIQCSIPFTRFYGELIRQPPEMRDMWELFGRPFPGETPWSVRP